MGFADQQSSGLCVFESIVPFRWRRSISLLRWFEFETPDNISIQRYTPVARNPEVIILATLSDDYGDEPTNDASLTRKTTYEQFSDEILQSIFVNLDFKSLLRAAQCCLQWYRVALDDSLWRRLFTITYNIASPSVHPPDNTSWCDEFARLYMCVPCKETETLYAHTDEVLHVSFAHQSDLFVSVSKDGTFKLWKLGNPSRLLHNEDMLLREWGHVMNSEFNRSDTLLAVSGVHALSSFYGEVAIYSIQNEKVSFIQSVHSSPYDIFATWLDDDHYLSGKFNQAQTELCINTACDIVTSASNYTDTVLAQKPYGWFRMPLIAQPPNSTDKILIHFVDDDVSTPSLLCFTRLQTTNVLSQLDPDTPWQRRKTAKRSLRSPEHVTDSCSSGSAESDSEPERRWQLGEPEFMLNVGGRLLGMNLSPDHRYLFANVRQRLPDSESEISKDISVQCIDLTELHNLDYCFQGAKGFTRGSDAFLIYVHASDDLLVSGSEDSFAYVWDRRHRVLVARLKSDSVVSGAVFCPRDPHVLVSYSDDHTVRVWRSRTRVKELHNA